MKTRRTVLAFGVVMAVILLAGAGFAWGAQSLGSSAPSSSMPMLRPVPTTPPIPKNTRGYPAPPVTIFLQAPIRHSFYRMVGTPMRMPAVWHGSKPPTFSTFHPIGIPPVWRGPEPSTWHPVENTSSAGSQPVQHLGGRTLNTLTSRPQGRVAPLIVDTSHIWAKYFDNIGYGPPNGYKFINSTSNPNGYTTLYVGYNQSDPPVTLKAFVNGKQVSWQCGCNAGLCEIGITLPPGASIVQAEMTDANNNTYDSNPVTVYYDSGDGHNLPQPANQAGQCQNCVGGSDPVNAVTGEMYSEHKDIQLEGPFGLSFERWYHSNQAYDGFMTSDLGPGWRNNYDAALNVSNIANGQAVFYDEVGNVVYFGGLAPSTTVYEQMAGDTLVMNADSTFKLTTWHGKVYTFDSSGRLSSLTDRNGNVQTVVRQSNPKLINYVSDALGRRLTFSYDSSNRIISVTSTPSGASVTFSYAAGTNCAAGDLCKATEVDNSVWTYQYADDYDSVTGQTFHLLTKLLDPLNHVVNQQTYGLASDGFFFTSTQQTDSGQNSLTFTYTGYNNTVTDGNSRTTTYQVDTYNNTVFRIEGPLCKCGGAEQQLPGYEGFDFSFLYGPMADPFMRLTNPFVYSTTDSKNHHESQFTYDNDAFFQPPDGGSPYIQTAYREPTVKHDILAATGPPYPTDRYTYFAYFQPNGPAGTGNPLQDLVQTMTQDSVDTSGKSILTTYAYNSQGLLTSTMVQGYIGGNSQTITTSSTWDSRGRVLTTTGPRTDVTQKTTFFYYPDNGSDLATAGQLNTVTDAVGNVTIYGTGATGSYNVYGKPLSITDPNNVKTTMTYDGLGRKKTSTIVGTIGGIMNPTTIWTYDLFGNLTKKALPLGNATAYSFDTNNRLLTTTTLDKNNLQHDQTVLAYDTMGQMTSKMYRSCNTPATTCAAWTTQFTESYKFDSFGRLSEIDHLDGTKLIKGYSQTGELTSIQDENHSSANITYAYDLAGRLLTETDMLSAAPGGSITTSYSYDELDHKTQTTDPNTNVTTAAYDDFGRKKSEISPVSGTTAYTYDLAGNLTNKNDANSNQVTCAYDALDRRLTEKAKNGSIEEDVTFTYDTATYGKGRLASMTDPSGSTSYMYEQRGLVTQESVTLQSNAYTISHGYDGNGNENSTTYPDGKVVTYTFDWADRPITAKQGSTTFVSAVTYEPFGPPTKLTFGNTTSQTFSYDQRYRVKENKLAKSGTLADYKYAEDSVGNITQIHDAVSGNAYNRDFQYDDLNRLTTANSGSSLWGGSSGYTYDSMGNMKTAVLGTAKNDTFSYSGTLPKLTSVTENGTPRTVGYDSNGNETQVGSAAYTYSPRNLLATGDSTGGTYTYTYDGRGVRNITATSAGKRYSFYDTNKRLLSESAITSSGKPAVAYDYIWIGDRPVGEIASGTAEWTFADHLGTPEIQMNNGGTIIYQAEFEPYGKVFTLRSGDLHQPLRLPGQVAEQFDTGANGATERSYNVNRWYHPSWGRYSQADPNGLLAGTDLFVYAADNPQLRSDPNGLCPTKNTTTDCPGAPGSGYYNLFCKQGITPTENDTDQFVYFSWPNPRYDPGGCAKALGGTILGTIGAIGTCPLVETGAGAFYCGTAVGALGISMSDLDKCFPTVNYMVPIQNFPNFMGHG